MNNILLQGLGLYKKYRNGQKEVRAVDGIDIDIVRARSLALVGSSGAGKSTVLHLLGGLDSPSSGEVRLDGVDVYRLSDRERARIRSERIGFIFQFYHLLPEFTALENVMLPAMMHNKNSPRGKAKNALRSRAIELLAMVGLSDRMTHRPGELSGGESQRVAIARALVNEPDILLCDEPTGNLDSKTSEAMLELLFAVKARTSMALVIVTHDDRIAKRTDETIRIQDGRIVS